MFASESLHKKSCLCNHSFEDAFFVPSSMSTDLDDDNLTLQINLYWTFLNFPWGHKELVWIQLWRKWIGELDWWLNKANGCPTHGWRFPASLHLLSSVPAAGKYCTPAALAWATSYPCWKKKPVTVYGREEKKCHENGHQSECGAGGGASQPVGESKKLLRRYSAGFMKACVTDGGSWGRG